MKRTLITILFLTLFLTPSYAKANDIDSLIFYPQDATSIFEEPDIEAFSPLLIAPNEVIFKQNSRKVDHIDPNQTASQFPGGRGANQLIIYTHNFGSSTGTNEFGTEAIVENNTVVALSGANSTIPKNGVVISGHGVAKNWITQNLSVGSKVYIDKLNSTITAYTTTESYTYEAKSKINEAKSIIDYYTINLSGYNHQLPNSHIQTAQNYLKIAENESKNSSILKQYTQEAIDSANLAIKTAVPYLKDELKGTWIRPTETTKEQIIATLEKIEDSGFNNIYLETYFHGKTIFPSKVMNKYGFTVQNEIFEGFDPLEVWIKEAHKRDIQVHIWFQSFYVGNKPPESSLSNILAVRPDWGNKLKKDANSPAPSRSTSEHNGYFIDPANPEVQTFLLELLDEIITEYKPDGINLDYIRYPNSTSSRSNNGAWGFTEYARNDFQILYGVDPVELTPSDPMWLDWNEYRRGHITNFVKKVGKLCRDKHVYISTVIFPDLASALSTKQQDWRTWSTKGYIDGFTPLFLTNDSQMLASMMRDVMQVKAPETELYAGLFVTFMGGAPEDLIRQIYQTRKMKANGVIIFDYAHTTPVYTTTLMAGAFNKDRQKEKPPEKKEKKKEKQEKIIKEKKKTKVIPTTNSKGNWVFKKAD